jgi:drug/metabolite transporter (DMT)-like permease
MSAYFSLFFISSLWGSSFVLIRIMSAAIDPLGVAAGRVGIAAVALIIVAAIRGSAWPGTLPVWRKLAALAVLGQIFPFFMLGIAGRLATSVDMAVMMGAAPLATFVLARFMPPTEAWSAPTALGIGLGFAGVAIALAAPADLGSAASATAWAGRLCAVLAAVGYALGTVISRDISRQIGSTMVVTASMAASTLLLGLVWLGTHPLPSAAGLAAVPRGALAALVMLGLVNTALTYVVYFRLVQTAGATFASLNNYLVPLVGLVIGALTLGEKLSVWTFAGLALILGGVVLVRSGRRATLPPAPPLRESCAPSRRCRCRGWWRAPPAAPDP